MHNVAPVDRQPAPLIEYSRETISGTPFYDQNAYQGYGQPIYLYPENLMRQTETGVRGANY